MPGEFLLRPVQIEDREISLEVYRLRLEREQREALEGFGTGEWSVPSSLVDKVEPDGRLREFVGDTLVWPLPGPALQAYAQVQSELCQGLENCLAEPLVASTLHVTLHDLAPPGDLERNQVVCDRLFGEICQWLQRRPELRRVRLLPTRIFPCLNISCLVGFVPATEQDFRVLLNFWQLFQEVRLLPGFLRPHLTLAYFRPRALEGSEVRRFRQRLSTCRSALVPLEFDLGDLCYQHFCSMNEYRTRLVLGRHRSAGCRP